MKFSKLTDYAVMVLEALSRDAESLDEDPVSASVIAELSHVPEPTVSKILKILTRAGITRAQRGAQGGYHLARALSELSVLDVLTAIEGPLSMTECASDECASHCALEDVCAVSGHWDIVNRAMESVLRGITIDELLKGKA